MNQKSSVARIAQQQATVPILQQRLPMINVPVGLDVAVLERIREAEVRGLRWRIAMSFAGFLVSISTIILSWGALWSELAGSSFLSLIRLGFSDSDIVFANLGSSINGLLESFPVMPALLGLVTLFCLVAVVGLLQTLHKVRHTSKLHLA